MEKHKESIGENCQNGILNAKTSGTPRPNVPALRFPEFTDEWKEVLFASNLERLENGANYNTNDKDGVPMSRIETISTGRIDYTKVGHCSTPQKIEHYIMRYGDILFSHINSLKHIGKTAYYSAEEPLYHGMNLLLFRCKNNVDSKFFFFLINNTHFIRKCQILAKQAVNQASISTSDLKKIKVYIPDINEQSKIQKFLSLIEKRIELQNKIIEKYESLIQAIIYQKKTDGIRKGNWQKAELSKVLQERTEKNINGYTVCSVSVSQGVINQIEYLGRSFAAKETSHYNVVKYGDIVYTKSPTGDFPYGIVKRSYIKNAVAVSPLYGVYKPINDNIGVILHFYFMQPNNAFNYLYPLIQKGAKNTINITNTRFLENSIPLPKTEDEAVYIANALTRIQTKIDIEKSLLRSYEREKQYLLRQMFI